MCCVQNDPENMEECKDNSEPKLETQKKKITSRLVIYINKVVFVLVGMVVGAAAIVLGTAVAPIVIAIARKKTNSNKQDT